MIKRGLLHLRPRFTLTSDWVNFENWLNSSQGWTFYLVLLVTISLIPILIAFLSFYRKRRLDLFPAVWIFVGLDLLPASILTASYARGTSASDLYPKLVLAAFVLIPTAALATGIIVQRRRHEKQRLPAILIWLGLSLTPVILITLIPTYYFPAVWAGFMLIFAVPLSAGMIGLAFSQPLAEEPNGPGDHLL